MRWLTRTACCVGLVALLPAPGGAGAPQAPGDGGATARVVFVCEHGAAKSLIAAVYFNALAAERGLPHRATFRAVTPQDDLSVRAVAGLRADGLAIPEEKPTALADGDIANATHVFAIGCTLPAAARSSGKAASWDDVPDDRGYPAMRDAIVAHVRRLLDEVQRR